MTAAVRNGSAEGGAVAKQWRGGEVRRWKGRVGGTGAWFVWEVFAPGAGFTPFSAVTFSMRHHTRWISPAVVSPWTPDAPYMVRRWLRCLIKADDQPEAHLNNGLEKVLLFWTSPPSFVQVVSWIKWHAVQFRSHPLWTQSNRKQILNYFFHLIVGLWYCCVKGIIDPKLICHLFTAPHFVQRGFGDNSHGLLT